MNTPFTLLHGLIQRGLSHGSAFFSLVVLSLLVGVQPAQADLLVLNSAGSSSHINRFNATTGALMNSFGYSNEGMYSLTVTSLNEVLVNSNILGGYDLYRFTAAGEYRGSMIYGEQAGLHGATRGPDGNLYLIWWDYPAQTARIIRVDRPAPTTFVAAGSGGMTSPTWLIFGPDGNLYVNDAQAGILRFNGATGAPLGVFVAPGSGGLQGATRIVFGPDGRLYVPSTTGNSVLRFDGASGAFVDTFVGPAAGGLINPRGIAFGPDGHLCVTSQGTRQVLRYDGQTGAYLGVAAQVEGAASDPRINLGDIAFIRAEAAGDTVWFDDATPAGAVTGTSHGGPWAWVTSNPPPIGTRSHRTHATFTSENVAGLQEHWFNFATETMTVRTGDTLFVHVYLHSEPYGQREIMVSWCDGTWNHRAYWGADLINEGQNGTASRRYLGALPRSTGWVRLEMPASLLGLEGRTVQGLAFSTVNLAATFDRVGQSTPGAVGGIDTTPPTVRLLQPASGTTVSNSMTWQAEVADNGPMRAVEFHVDGTRITTTGANPPYSNSWDTKSVPNGSHVLTAVAIDAAGNRATSASVTVTVNNTTPTPATATWFDDDVPAGAQTGASGGDGWNWVSAGPVPHSGTRAHQSNLASGLHEHYFNYAGPPLNVAVGDSLLAWIYIDPANVPQEIMLSWNDGTSWEHRAYWGANLISYGMENTDGRRYLGPLPAAGQWVRLEVPAAQVGLAGSNVQGMSFTLYGGRATWDAVGKTASPGDGTAPSVALTAPANGASVERTVTLTATASDNVGVSAVEFFVDGASIGQDPGSPYSVIWDTTTAASGAHTLTARARDAAGNQATSIAVSVTVSNPTTPPSTGADTIWFDDSLPAGATIGGSGGDGWNWITSGPTPRSGTRAHQSNLAAGLHEHSFDWATGSSFAISAADTLFAWVYLDPANLPQEIMLSWRDGANWEHRAYWGADLIGYGSNGTASRRHMGALPTSGGWTKLIVPANSVGLGASPLIGMSFGAFGGRVTWDATGKVGGSGGDTSPPTTIITFPDPGARLSGSVTLTTTPSDNMGIARIDFAVDGVVVGSPGGPNAGGPYQPNMPLNGGASFSITWNSATVANGAHVVTAIAYDAAGNRGTSPGVTVSVSNSSTTPADTTPPTVSISAPAANAVVSGSAVRLSALASDNAAVASVRFRLDEVDIGSPDTIAPFFLDWNSTTAANGSHAMTAVATDSAGNQTTSSTVIFSVNNTGSPATSAVIWMDSAVPANAVTGSSGGDTWNWVTTNPTPFAGTRVHQSAIAAGVHDHFFVNSTSAFALFTGDTIFAYVYLDPANIPSEIMLSFNDGTWEHRAYWGSNAITYGQDGTNSRRSIGPLPAAGQWVRLEVPARLVGLEGRTIHGVSFTLVGGRATWDIVGKVSP